MTLSREERQQICEEEKARVERQEKVKAELTAKNSKQGFMGCLGVLVIAGVILVIANRGTPHGGGPTPAAPPSNQSSSRSVLGMIGTTATVKTGSFAFLSTDAVEKAETVFAEGDEPTFRRYCQSLERSDQAFNAPAGAAGTILDFSGFGPRTMYQLKFTDGAITGRAGWMYASDLRFNNLKTEGEGRR